MDFAATLPPLLGQFTALFLFFSPLREVREQRKKGVVDIDCLPFVVTLVQHILWVTYAGLLHDLWIFVPNMLGIFGTVFYITSGLRYQTDEKMMSRMEVLLSVGLGFSVVFLMFAMTPLFVESAELRMSICGSICLVICVAMYSAPCIEAVRAVLSNDASRLSKGLAVAGCLNGGLWGTYGLAIGNFAVAVPNALGLAVSLVNLVVKLCCSSKITEHESVESLLQKASNEDLPVRIYSLAHKAQLNVQSFTAEKETAISEGKVCSAAAGVAMHVVPMSAGHVAFRFSDGRFLCVSARSQDSLGCTDAASHQPSAFTVKAKFAQEPGPDNEFQVFSSSGVGLHHDEQKMCVYGSEAVSFWSPVHQVLLRLNELGDFDCSPPLVPGGNGQVRLPGGWSWERFRLMPAEPMMESAV